MDFSSIPSVDKLVRHARLQAFESLIQRKVRVRVIRQVLTELRGSQAEILEETLLTTLEKRMASLLEPGMRKVLNATGIVLHTNLGRAPLGKEVLQEMADTIDRYCTLEFDTETGERGSRTARVEEWLRLLCDAEAAVVVNNNAGAVLLMLQALSSGKEVILSRGELVQIGGGFRIPEILKLSGARLVEVGTTNITTISDYQKNVSSETSAILKVHQSNFVISGHTEETSLSDLAKLADARNLSLLVDLGSGALDEMQAFEETTISRCLESGSRTVVCFSGDKLLGGPQAGIILGPKVLLDKIKNSPLYRALRISKTECFILERILSRYIAGKINPSWELLQLSPEQMMNRAKSFALRLTDEKIGARVSAGISRVGGGASPATEIPTTWIELACGDSQAMFRKLLKASPPVVVLKDKGLIRLDLRTIFPDEEESLLQAIREAFPCQC